MTSHGIFAIVEARRSTHRLHDQSMLSRIPMRAVHLVTFLFILSVTGRSQSRFDAMERSVRDAQDMRDSRSILLFLSDPDPSTRAMAALAAGSVQDTIHLPVLQSLLADASERVRKASAFALGQMNYICTSLQREKLSETLDGALRIEHDREVLLTIVGALGKVGDDQHLNRLVRFGDSVSDPVLRAEIALSIGRYAYRNIKSAEAARFAAGLLPTPGDSWKPAYALMRIGEKSLLEPHADVILAASAHNDAETRTYIMTVLGRLGDARAVPGLVAAASSDPDWRVRVNAVKALGLFDPGLSADAIIAACVDSVEGVSLTALVTLGGLQFGDDSFVERVRALLMEIAQDEAGRYSSRQNGEAAIAFAKLFPSKVLGVLDPLAREEKISPDAWIGALAHAEGGHVAVGPFTLDAFDILIVSCRNTNVQTRRIALESLESFCTRAPSPQRIERARVAFLDALSSDDVAVISTAASALADSIFADSVSVGPLTAALSRLGSADDGETMAAIIESLGKLKHSGAVPLLTDLLGDPDRTVALASANALDLITGESHKALLRTHSRPAHVDHDWDRIEEIAARPLVDVVTDRGDFTMKMLPKNAPFTCLNFARLIDRGFYDGLTFHRVVPNFVVQGGDPRGDGWGGPGYAIRSEFGFKTYEQGSVGVASAGKDTEGCQFFVTHSRQPHLDGRYTIFAEVVSGMNVVDRLQIGDKILSVRFLEKQ